MIFYFSGSGNSYATAKQVADKLHDKKVVSIASFNDFQACKDEERIGMVFPCHIGRAPNIVLDFKSKLLDYINKSSTYIFCIVTYANHPAISYFDFKDYINAWFEVKMPENDIAHTKAPTVDKEKVLLFNAKKKIDRFADDILHKKHVAIRSQRRFIKLLLKVLDKPMKKQFLNFYQKLYADESCSKCKQCIKYCPVQNITFGTKPEWGAKCVNCFGCVNRCPRKSIQCGRKTIGKRRYVHPDFKNVFY